MDLEETCSCGAKFYLRDMGSIPNAAAKTAQTWRETHRHEATTPSPAPRQ